MFFLQISHEGYLYEKNHAFFPLYPALIKAIGFPISFILNQEDSHLLAGVAISWASFVISVYYLYHLTLLTFEDALFARKVTLLFLWNPASIFMTSVYTTSLFTALSISGVFYLYKTKSTLLPSLLFSLATATRSNGSLLFIFSLCFSIQNLYRTPKLTLYKVLTEFFMLGLSGFIHALPIFIVLLYGSSIYCTAPHLSEYCLSYVPNIYSYIQKTYWNVGLFNYWEVKQLPNFILPLPILYLSVSSIYSAPARLAPFSLYLLANLFILIFIANIQISTRVLSSVPLIY